MDSLESLKPGWLEISVEIDPVTHEGLNSFLFDLGCDGIVSESFHDQTIRAYFPIGVNPEYLRGKLQSFLDNLKEIFPQIKPFSLTIAPLEDTDWNLAWRRFFKPDKITENLMVVPAWETAHTEWNGHVIRIDPGPAFGTGQHPTTRMCLSAMEKISFPGSWKMMDVGTGSGILSIYGIMLGAEEVEAIDIDPDALRWAEWNIELNNLSERIRLSDSTIKGFHEDFFLVMANLILGTILELKFYLNRTLTPGGYLVLSGLLKEQVGEVELAFHEYELEIDEVLFMEEWACMIFMKTNRP